MSGWSGLGVWVIIMLLGYYNIYIFAIQTMSDVIYFCCFQLSYRGHPVI